jgi:hypothetical protein
MTSFKHLQQKLMRFGDLRTQQSEQCNRLRQALIAVLPKRAVPDWLQASLESQGFVFDAGGQVISSPDRPSSEPVRMDV